MNNTKRNKNVCRITKMEIRLRFNKCTNNHNGTIMAHVLDAISQFNKKNDICPHENIKLEDIEVSMDGCKRGLWLNYPWKENQSINKEIQ